MYVNTFGFQSLKMRFFIRSPRIKYPGGTLRKIIIQSLFMKPLWRYYYKNGSVSARHNLSNAMGRLQSDRILLLFSNLNTLALLAYSNIVFRSTDLQATDRHSSRMKCRVNLIIISLLVLILQVMTMQKIIIA